MPFNWVSLWLFCLRFCISRRQFAAGEGGKKKQKPTKRECFEKTGENVVSFSMRNNVWVKMQTCTAVLIDVASNERGKSDEKAWARIKRHEKKQDEIAMVTN